MKNSKLALAVIAGTISIALCAPVSFAKSTGNDMFSSKATEMKRDEIKKEAIDNKTAPKHQHKKAAMKKHSSSRSHGKKGHHSSH